MKFSMVISAPGAKFSAYAIRGDFEESMRRVAELGYEGVELGIRRPEDLKIDAIRELLARYGLALAAIGTGRAYLEDGLSLTDPDEEVRKKALVSLREFVRRGAPFGARVILGLIRGRSPERVAAERVRAWLREGLGEADALAQELDARLALEPINRYETDLLPTISDAAALIEEAGAGATGILADTFHMNIEEVDIEESIRQHARLLTHFHVADSNRWPPGGGHLDFKKILSALEDTGYSGFVSVECLPKPDPEGAARCAIEHLRALGL